MTSNSQLSEIKLLLHSLASDIKAVKADVAELKKNQIQIPESGSTCSSCAARSSKAPKVEKEVNNTEKELIAKVRSTQSVVSQLIEEEKTLILAEVVQLSRAVGEALENAKGKMMAKVGGFTGGDEHGRKRRRSAADLDGDGDLDAGEKRMKRDEESEADEDGTDDDEDDTDEDDSEEDDADDDDSGDDDDDGIAQRRQNSTAIDEAVLDIMSRAHKALDCERVGLEWVLMALFKFHSSASDETLELWEAFQNYGTVCFEYCLYGIFYHGHEHEGVAAGKCSCRERHPPGLRQRATRCIRVRRGGDGSGKLMFSWGADIGPAPVLGKYE